MTTFAISLDFESASIDLRSKAIPSDEILESMTHALQERVFLKTCNRVELYGVGEIPAEEILRNWILGCGLSGEEQKCFQVLKGAEVIRHLLRVTSSLESMVIGETQITGQVKRAYDEACEKNWVGTKLHLIFQASFRLAKRVRSETDVGRLAVSIPSLGVKLAEKIFGEISERSVGVLGLGEIGRVAAEHFYSVSPRALHLWNRTTSVSEEVARALGQGGSTPIGVAATVEDLIRQSEIIVSAANASLITEAHIELLESRATAFLLLDLSVPPSIPRMVLQSGLMFGIDDLKSLAEENVRIRVQEMQKAEGLIEREVTRLLKGAEDENIRQALSQLSQKMNETTKKELAHLKGRLPGLDEQSWAEIEKMAYRLSSKVLQDPVVELRSRARADEESASWLETFKSLFRI